MIYLQWFSVIAKIEGKLPIVERSVTTMNGTVMVGTDQYYILLAILATSA